MPEQDSSQGQPKSPRKILRRAGAAAAGIATVAGLGLGAKEVLTSESSPNRPTATSTSTAPSTTEAPASKAGFEQKEGGIVYLTEKGETIAVPAVTGLTASLENNSVLYKDSVGVEKGMFKPNVFMEQADGSEKQTGGLVLKPDVALRILNEQLAAIPTQRDRWLIPLPSDISDIDSKVALQFGSFTHGDAPNKYTVPHVDVTCTEPAPLMNIIPNTKEVRISKNYLFGYTYIDRLTSFQPYGDSIVAGKEMQYITVNGHFKGFTDNATIPSMFGDTLSPDGGGVVKIFYGITGDQAADYRDIDPSKILSISNTPVFVAAGK